MVVYVRRVFLRCQSVCSTFRAAGGKANKLKAWRAKLRRSISHGHTLRYEQELECLGAQATIRTSLQPTKIESLPSP